MIDKFKNRDTEKIYTVIIILFIIVALATIIYTIFSSTNKLYSNDIEESTNLTQNNDKSNNTTTDNNNSNNSTNNTTTDNQNNVSQEELNNMNVEQEKLNQQTTNTQPEQSNQQAEQKQTNDSMGEQLASYTTTIYDKDENRVHNISLAISKLNNTIVKAGEEFSFNKTIGAMGPEQGYKEALGFDTTGRKIKISGGGLCQISSTLYNSVLIANLNVTERHPHSRRVYYVPKGKDATIAYGSSDFKFINNTDSDIKITASNDTNNVTVNLNKVGT